VPSLTRGRVCSLQCNHLQVRVAQDPNHTSILVSFLRLPQPEGLGSRIHIPRNRDYQLYPRASTQRFYQPLVWQDVPQRRDSNHQCNRHRSWDPEGARHQDTLTDWPSDVTWLLTLTFKLWPTASRPVHLVAGFPSGAHEQIFTFSLKIAYFFIYTRSFFPQMLYTIWCLSKFYARKNILKNNL
jgi:hypothetical protein